LHVNRIVLEQGKPLQHATAVSGPATGARSLIASVSAAQRDMRMEAIGSGAGAKRLGRHDDAAAIRASDLPEDAAAVIARRQVHDRPGQRSGAPSSAFIAQHIAQEVSPDAPGFDRYQAGAQAYVMRRDSTIEILASTGRLDILI
jgi:hypothetical protein